ncbi:hypothetical protein [Microcoleus sp. bin38.metabat.b11b12b14.051]|uniref:hypothetical protein n=1 Tax=Microcoleus sp. bin38.metabat.b11b12b14.051 TaxID=2742709 RepID=UPI0025FFB609|nr:hypothetical protein [Microcoleus sp. bin38.metabat.b11b12b14.051]
MAILLCHNLKSQLRISHRSPKNQIFGGRIISFDEVQNLQASVPYFYQDNTCAIALARATVSSATRDRLLSAIVLCQDG